VLPPFQDFLAGAKLVLAHLEGQDEELSPAMALRFA
jgi:hypothetical protein